MTTGLIRMQMHVCYFCASKTHTRIFKNLRCFLLEKFEQKVFIQCFYALNSTGFTRANAVNKSTWVCRVNRLTNRQWQLHKRINNSWFEIKSAPDTGPFPVSCHAILLHIWFYFPPMCHLSSTALSRSVSFAWHPFALLFDGSANQAICEAISIWQTF